MVLSEDETLILKDEKPPMGRAGRGNSKYRALRTEPDKIRGWNLVCQRLREWGRLLEKQLCRV